jgi:hypothetical protein
MSKDVNDNTVVEGKCSNSTPIRTLVQRAQNPELDRHQGTFLLSPYPNALEDDVMYGRMGHL